MFLRSINQIFLYCIVLSSSVWAEDLSPQQWHLRNYGQAVLTPISNLEQSPVAGQASMDIGLGGLLNKRIAGRSPVIAVLDMGIDFDHPGLQGQIALNEIECDRHGHPPTGASDKDGNGYAGDCAGWNFVENNNRPMDRTGHGVYLSGTMAGKSYQGFRGISPDIKILPLKVYKDCESDPFLQNYGQSCDSTRDGVLRIEKALDYAISRQVDVINLSLVWPRLFHSEKIKQSVERATEAGILIIAAAGNERNESGVYPCVMSDVICVGSITHTGELTSHSSRGSFVELLAPGQSIFSFSPLDKNLSKAVRKNFDINGLELADGTSSAAAMASAGFAVLSASLPAVNSMQEKRRRRRELIARVLSTSQKLRSKNVQPGFVNGGLIQIEKALQAGQQSFVRLDLKSQREITYNEDDGSFELPIKAQALWREADDLQLNVSVSEQSSHISLVKNQFNLNSLPEGEEHVFTISGRVRDFLKSAYVNIQVDVTVAGRVQDRVSHQFVLVRDINRIKQRITIDLPAGMNEIRTVESPFPSDQMPWYYSFAAGNSEVELTLFKLNDKLTSFAKRSRSLPSSERVIGAWRVDLDFDGDLDFFVASIGRIKSLSSQPVILFSYLDSELSDLLKTGPYIALTLDDNVPLNFKNMNWVRAQVNGQIVAAPVFINTGEVTQASSSKDPFEPEYGDFQKQIFYLQPTDGALPEFSLHTLGNQERSDQILETMGLRWSDRLLPIALFKQSQEDLYNGAPVSAFLAGGLEPASMDYVKLEVHQKSSQTFSFGSFDTVPVEPQYVELAGANIVDLIPMNSSSSKDDNEGLGFVSFFPLENLVETTFVRKTSVEVEEVVEVKLNPKNGFLTGVLPHFFDENRNEKMAFFFTEYSLMGVRSQNGRIKAQHSIPLNYIKSLPLDLFHRNFSPLVFRRSKQRDIPGFLTDLSQLYSARTQLIAWKGDHLVAPMDTSFKMPSGCSAFPPFYSKRNVSVFPFVCSKQGRDNKIIFASPLR